MNRSKLLSAIAMMADRQAKPVAIAKALGITTTTLYVYVNHDGSVKKAGQDILDGKTLSGGPAKSKDAGVAGEKPAATAAKPRKAAG